MPPTRAPSQGHDVLVCHGESDERLVAELSTRLAAQGRSCFHAGALATGGSWSEAIVRATAAAKVAVILVRASLWKSRKVELTLTAIAQRTATDPTFVLVPVLLATTEVPAFLAGKAYLDATSLEKDALLEAIVRTLETGLSDDAPRFPTA